MLEILFKKKIIHLGVQYKGRDNNWYVATNQRSRDNNWCVATNA